MFSGQSMLADRPLACDKLERSKWSEADSVTVSRASRQLKSGWSCLVKISRERRSLSVY